MISYKVNLTNFAVWWRKSRLSKRRLSSISIQSLWAIVWQQTNPNIQSSASLWMNSTETNSCRYTLNSKWTIIMIRKTLKICNWLPRILTKRNLAIQKWFIQIWFNPKTDHKVCRTSSKTPSQPFFPIVKALIWVLSTITLLTQMQTCLNAI